MAYAPFDKDSMLSMDSVPWEGCDMSADVAVEKIHHRLAERREVERRTTGNQIVVHDDRFVHPDAAGIFQVILDAERAGNAFAFENLRGDGNPPAVTDEGDELALLEELPRKRENLCVTPQLVRHETAGNEQAEKIFAMRVLEQQVGLGGITVLALVGLDLWRGEAYGVARLFAAQLRIPEFQVLVDVVHERQQYLLHDLSLADREVTARCPDRGAGPSSGR